MRRDVPPSPSPHDARPTRGRPARGRPRSEPARRAVLDAAKALLQVKPCVRDITIDALAKAAGVGRPTIYRWWPGATAVVLDAFLEDVMATFPTPRKGTSAAAALERQIVGIVRVLRGPQGRVIAELLAEGQSHPELLALFRERFLFLRRQAVRDILDRGIAAGAFRPDVDPDFVIDLITGPAYHRRLSGHRPVSDAFARQIAAHVLDWLTSARSQARGPKRRSSPIDQPASDSPT